MEINDFITQFADQFEETDISEFVPETQFKTLDEWSSLTGLAILNMVKAKYGYPLTAAQLTNASTIQDLFLLINK